MLELHPQELERRQWAAGDLVRVTSRRGSAVLPVQGSESVAPAQAFVAETGTGALNSWAVPACRVSMR